MTDNTITHVVLVHKTAELRNAAGETVGVVPAENCSDFSDELFNLYEAFSNEEPYPPESDDDLDDDDDI